MKKFMFVASSNGVQVAEAKHSLKCIAETKAALNCQADKPVVIIPGPSSIKVFLPEQVDIQRVETRSGQPVKMRDRDQGRYRKPRKKRRNWEHRRKRGKKNTICGVNLIDA